MAKGFKTGGRKKGTPNVLSGDLKGIVLESFTAVGGADYLIEQAAKNPVAYMSLLGKILPFQLNGPAEDGAHLHRIVRDIVDPINTNG